MMIASALIIKKWLLTVNRVDLLKFTSYAHWCCQGIINDGVQITVAWQTTIWCRKWRVFVRRCVYGFSLFGFFPFPEIHKCIYTEYMKYTHVCAKTHVYYIHKIHTCMRKDIYTHMHSRTSIQMCVQKYRRHILTYIVYTYARTCEYMRCTRVKTYIHTYVHTCIYLVLWH